MSDIDLAIKLIPPDWRYRWCNNQACACIGCANRSGGLTAKGFTEKDHRDWVFKTKNK